VGEVKLMTGEGVVRCEVTYRNLTCSPHQSVTMGWPTQETFFSSCTKQSYQNFTRLLVLKVYTFLSSLIRDKRLFYFIHIVFYLLTV
jgi:hypothetical protein